MKRLLLILLCPLVLLAQDTITVVGPKAGSKGGEIKKIIIGPTSATISQGVGTFTFPTGGTPDSSIWAKKWWVTYSIDNAPGGGSYSWTELTRTTADTTMAVINTGIKVIGGLEFPMLANKAYAVEYWIVHGNVAATTSGMVLGHIGPNASVAALTAEMPNAVDGVAAGWQGWLNGVKDSTVSTATPVVSVWLTSHIFGVVYNGANAGTFSIAWRPEAAANTTVRQNSHMKYKQLN
mgnify:CR=1 FL=1